LPITFFLGGNVTLHREVSARIQLRYPSGSGYGQMHVAKGSYRPGGESGRQIEKRLKAATNSCQITPLAGTRGSGLHHAMTFHPNGQSAHSNRTVASTQKMPLQMQWAFLVSRLSVTYFCMVTSNGSALPSIRVNECCAHNGHPSTSKPTDKNSKPNKSNAEWAVICNTPSPWAGVTNPSCTSTAPPPASAEAL